MAKPTKPALKVLWYYFIRHVCTTTSEWWNNHFHSCRKIDLTWYAASKFPIYIVFMASGYFRSRINTPTKIKCTYKDILNEKIFFHMLKGIETLHGVVFVFKLYYEVCYYIFNLIRLEVCDYNVSS